MLAAHVVRSYFHFVLSTIQPRETAGTNQPLKLLFGQSSFVYFNYPLRQAIESLGRLGYDCVEIWGGRPHYYHDDLDEELPALLKLLEKYGMSVPNCIPAQFRYPFVLCSANEKVRIESVQHVTKTIDTALKFHARTVSICPGTYIDDQDLSKGWKTLKQSILEILDYCDDKPLNLLIEPAHRWESNLIQTVQDCTRMLKEIGASNLGICLDIGHANVNGEDVYEAVMAASAYPLHLHLSDNAGAMDSHNLPGDGNINFEKLKRALKDCEYQGCLSVELGFQYTLAPEQAAKESLAFLRRTFH